MTDTAPDPDGLLHVSRSDPYVLLGLDSDPLIAFAGIRALRALAEICEAEQVTRLRNAGHTWAAIATWAQVSPQALHKKHRPRPATTARPRPAPNAGTADRHG